MKKRIYRSILLLVALTVFLSIFLTSIVVYRGFYKRMQREIRNEASYLAVGYDNCGSKIFYDLPDAEGSSRITWIDNDGRVLYDNVADLDKMENHSSRPEVINALKYGYGESVHLSDTLGEQTFYRAIRLEDGTILRVSSTIKSIYKSIFDFVPYFLIILLFLVLLTIFMGNKLTKKIVEPINMIDLKDPLKYDTYDELSPLLHRMYKQNNKIDRQFIKLKKQQGEFKAIIENVREGIIVLDNNGNILSINRSAAEIFNIKSEGNTGKHILTLNRSKTLQTAVQEAMDGNSYEVTFKKNNRIFNILSSPVSGEKDVKGVMLFLLDITEKEEGERMRREFSANVSHELKTPLTSIIGYSELMKNGMIRDNDYQGFSERIYDEARHLVSLVNDIIRLSRLDEKEIELSFENVDLFELTESVLDRLDSKAKQSKITLSIKGESALVSGVRQILEEMIYNLCDNAIKYNKENGKVNVSISDSLEKITLSVEDTGIGISEKDQIRIFERFYRVDKSHSRDTGGTGLGLSIVKHSAEFHGAKMKLESKLGIGTKITVIFDKTRDIL